MTGWLCCMDKPTEVNAADYFSGHYQRFGLAVQAMCDANLLFMYVGVAAPGKTNDLRAFNRLIKLKNWFDGLPPHYFVRGDNAYIPSRTICWFRSLVLSDLSPTRENLSFNIPDTNRDALGIEPIQDGPIGNNRFLELTEAYQQGNEMGLRSARRNWLLEEITMRGIIVTDVDEN
eukprot:scaffold246557_cov35-Attheya_sp.AAC.1